ncbi:DNA-protecting protein DprA [Candidatus Peregrinibacteria bacterium]|jgi:DNA processing protein|nr:DNA-protecting protein DprA [Candidatus Peregrinibacteria bacterium]MBT4147714.1 DNA-protecting protein DprA [Candidatus Peregrinibacteria bacterium]MBT4365792.1 DNA-protecting protein DprA [Candidatus Peregrinibacteria bacterium]MBT4455741.1 DNA-protecting protein DprA [Candidatus Peregrinibacteria bacterium]
MNNFIKVTDSSYPSLLKQIYKPPEKMYFNGDVGILGGNLIAFVGTRDFTPYGKYCVERIISELSLCDFVIVSGLARGIDTFAHKAALKNGLKTVAVLGTGINNVYPRENEGLAEEIVSSGGCILSEYEGDGPGRKFTFPMRNRIIAGLCVATVVVEAPESSGALITAKRANEENRDVFAIPGDIDRAESAGCNKLIQGSAACPVMSGMDIIRALKMQPELIKTENDAFDADSGLGDLNLGEQNLKVLNTISKTRPIFIDDLVERSGVSLVEANKTLSMLEINGLVQSSDNGFYLRCF